MKTIVAGISWFEREDYPRILEIMADADVFPPTYEAWTKKAEHDQRRTEAAGFTVVRVIIKPEEFIAWCTRNDMAVDAKARTAFAAEGARRRASH
jgi:hypothetical protein